MKQIAVDKIARKIDLESEGLNAISRTDTLIKNAMKYRVTDIHIDPIKDKVTDHITSPTFARIRWRIDGVICEFCCISRRSLREITARIKIISRLRTDIQHLPQDGRFELFGTSVRVSIVPSIFGESLVLRILNLNSSIPTFSGLGFDAETCGVIENAVQSPHGLIVVSGPTGSGKTTVLYSLINYIQDSNNDGLAARSIITIEDPVERTLTFARQIPVREAIGLNFSTLLRTVLRQDPDVLVIGEIRDRETASMAVGAAMTGHLVITTLHTSYAGEVRARLVSLGVDDNSFDSVHVLSLAVRLVRKICVPCELCMKTGWFGRTVISEYIYHEKNTEHKSKSIYSNGIQKALSGVTTKEEIKRVVREDL